MNTTVLVVEGYRDCRELLAETLRLEGWAAFTAANAEEAVCVARSVTLHVVLTDVVLPRTSGLAVEQSLKADPALSHIPFIFMMTGRSLPWMRSAGSGLS